jgi:glycogen synthase
MAAGRPVVGTNVGGVPWMVRYGVIGLLVPPKNAELLAKALDTGKRLPRTTFLRARASRFDWMGLVIRPIWREPLGQINWPGVILCNWT